MRSFRPQPVPLLLGSFLALILVGTLLLKLPFATPEGRPIPWIDALFTATSATCVTGLVVRDTGAAFTPFGQAVILSLIQLGGLGVMTFSLFVFALFRGRVSLAERSVIERTLTGRGLEDVLALLKLVFRFTILTEAAGAALLLLIWWPELGLARAAWAGIFHAVSAFCNAGFGLWSDSLVTYRGHLGVNLVVMALIVLGGLGFLVVYDLRRSIQLGRRPAVQSRLALLVSLILIAGGAVGIGLLEKGHSFAGLGWGETLLASLFQSVTARTAGFNTVDIAALAPQTLFFLTMLMFIGGSPGSCAGGIKTTTLGVLVLSSISRLRGRERVNVFYRTLSATTVRNSLSIALGGMAVAVLALFALLLIQEPEPGAFGRHDTFLDYFFETLSALGTVGLSTGVTPALEPGARLLVVVLMFAGRLGPLTVASALAGRDKLGDWRYPEEEVMVG